MEFSGITKTLTETLKRLSPSRRITIEKVRFDLGGGSALFPLPIDILTLEDKYRIIKLVQSKGATIQELNTVRQSMSQMKNGGFARMAKAKTVTDSSSRSSRSVSFSDEDRGLGSLGCDR